MNLDRMSRRSLLGTGALLTIEKAIGPTSAAQPVDAEEATVLQEGLIVPWKLQVSDETLADLRERLKLTRFPNQLADVPWVYGTDLAFMRRLIGYWIDGYAWRNAEAQLNRLPHYMANVAGQRLHFIHQRGKGPSPVPLLITHGTRILDAGGRLVTPGLTEAHVHLGVALPTPPLAMPNLPFPGPNAEQALAAVEQAAKTRTDWVTAYIGPLIARDRRNWRKALDAVAPNTPVFFRAFWGHTSIVNSEGLRRLGISKEIIDPLGGWWGRDEAGDLDGRAYEAAETITPRIRPATAESLAISLGEAQQRYARWGVTSIHLMNNDKSLEVTLAALAIAKPLQKWTVYSWGTWEIQRIPEAWAAIDRVAKQALPKVRVEGPKWIVDGTPIEQNSLQRTAYVDRPGWHGRSNFTDEQLREILQLALARPTQLALHVVGDAEIDRVLKMMEQLAPVATWRAKRVRIEHGDGIGRDVFEKAAQLGLVVIQNPTHLAIPPIAGKKMLDHEIVLKSFVNAGIPLALGSDGGVAEQNPFLNLALAVLVPSDPSEALTREQALTAYTAGGAYAEVQDQRKGRLAPGFTADLAVLSQDVLTVPTSRLPATTSLLTIVNGEVIFEDAMLTSPH